MAKKSIANEGPTEVGETTYRVVERHDSRLGQTVYDLMETREGIESRCGMFTEISVAYITLWQKRGWTS